jgi:hypothetical protein
MDAGVVILGSGPGAPQNRTGFGKNRTNTPYFDEKLIKLDDGVVDNSTRDPDKYDTYVNDFGMKFNHFESFIKEREGRGESRKNTSHLNAKLKRMDDGVDDLTTISNEKTSGDIADKFQYWRSGLLDESSFYDKGASGGNLHNLQEKLKALRNGTLH